MSNGLEILAIQVHIPALDADRPIMWISWQFRSALLLNACVAAFGLSTNMMNTLTSDNSDLPGLGDKVFDEFTYFTIQVTWVVLVVCVAYAIRPSRDTPLWRTLRFVALVGITMTGICYYALVASELHYTGIIAVGDVCAHVVSPILYVGTWLVFGPRGQARWSGVLAIVGYLIAWTVFTLARGEFTGLYPYGFTDARANGYVSVLTMSAVLTIFGAVLGIAALGLDQRFTRRHATTGVNPTTPSVANGKPHP
ncbi:MAG: Pr6Pr family membrane protein [Acidimicrobiia bacterium]